MPAADARKVDRRTLILHYCTHCGHLYQPAVSTALLDVIYSKYYRNYPYDASEAMQGPYREPFNRIFDLVVQTRPLPGERRLLEIGCSKPENLNPFVHKGFTCTGVDPSPLALQESGDPRISMFRGYYEKTALPGPFQIIVSRFNLEHVIHPDRMLAKMRKDLALGGLAIVQVPNVEYYLDKRQPVFVAHEHIQYFSAESLRRLFVRSGFQFIAGYHLDQPSIIACFVSARHRAPTVARARSPVFKSYLRDSARRRARLQAYLKEPRQVVLYGCGLALFSVLATLSSSQLKNIMVVDDNAAYEGACIPSYGIAVHHARAEILDGRDTIILTLNPMYHDRVLSQLRTIGRRLRVVCLRENAVEVLCLPGRQ